MPNGDISPAQPHGLFVQDTRYLSKWELTINGQRLEPLAAQLKEPYRALFAGRVPRSDGYADSPLILERLRELGEGIREWLTIRNFSLEPIECILKLSVAADFADLFEVKEARIPRQWEERRHAGPGVLTLHGRWKDLYKEIVLNAPDAEVTPEAITYRAMVQPGSEWSAHVNAVPSIGKAGLAAFSHEGGGCRQATGGIGSGCHESPC